MTEHLRDVSHRHSWRQYVLKDEYGIYYKGYRCIGCGAAGYEIPEKSVSGDSVEVAKVELVEPIPPTTQEWIDHLDEEHEETEVVTEKFYGYEEIDDERGQDRN